MEKIFYLITDSVTTAMKGYRILNKNGINARVNRTAPSSFQRGCGYSIVVDRDPQKAVEILERNNIKIKSIFEK